MDQVPVVFKGRKGGQTKEGRLTSLAPILPSLVLEVGAALVAELITAEKKRARGSMYGIDIEKEQYVRDVCRCT